MVKGKVRVVIYDRREDSDTKGEIGVFELSANKPQALVIPIGVVHGFECMSKDEAWILNVPSQLYNYDKPDEYRVPLNSKEIPYKAWWNKKGY